MMKAVKRMSRQERLKEIIQQKYHIIRQLPNFSATLGSPYEDEIRLVYKQLSCQPATTYPTNGRYDISTDEFIIELDEERHFNLYRAQTLESCIYTKLHQFPLNQYRLYCSLYEQQCLRAAVWGKNWSTPSADNQFGESDLPGNLNGSGSSRWKQRAFYDYLKDVTQLITKKPLARVSIYDKLVVGNTEKTVDEILLADEYLKYEDAVISFILQQV